MWRWVLTASVALAFLATPQLAGASTTIAPGSGTTYPYARWIERSKVPTPNIDVTVIEDGCFVNNDDVGGCTSPASTSIWVKPGRVAKVVFFHELGHQVDYRVLTDSDRARFMQIAGLAGEWRPEGAEGPNEYFAGVYEQCALGNWIGAPGRSLTPDRREPRVIPAMRQGCYFVRHLAWST